VLLKALGIAETREEILEMFDNSEAIQNTLDRDFTETREEALRTFGLFHDMITAPPDEATHRAVEDLGKLSVFSGVAEFPARVKCATLAWHALKAALTEGPAPTPVSTE